MLNKGPYLNKLFFPLTVMLVFLGISSTLSYKIGAYLQDLLMYKGVNLASIQTWSYIGSSLLFLGFLLSLKDISFRKIFRISLILVAVLLTLSLYVFPDTQLSYFFATLICPKLLIVLGWAYINQLTYQVEGSSYYFALGCAASLVLGALAFMPPLFNATSPSYPEGLFFAALASLGAVLLLDRWMFRKLPERGEFLVTKISLPQRWSSIVCLSFLLAGLPLLVHLNAPSFRTELEPLAQTSSDYVSFVGRHSMAVGVGSLLFLFVSLFLGPKLLRSQGWKVTTLLSPILAALTIIALFISQDPSVHSFSQVMFKGLDYAWVIPLVQIAFLSYSQKDRFLMQGLSFLVISPLFEWLGNLVFLRSFPALVISLIVIVLMIVSIVRLAKNNRALEEPVG